MNDLIDLAPPSRREHIVKHQVSGRVSDRFVAEMDTALQQIPTDLVDQVVKSGYTLAFVETVIEIRPDLRGKTPVDSSPGTTFENLRGFFDGETKTLYVPEYYRAKLQPMRGLVKNTIAAAVLRHERGHALDRALGLISATPEFQQAYEADLTDVPDDLIDYFTYFWQSDNNRNCREVFAELFAVYYGGGPHDRSRQIRLVFNRCDDVLRKRIQGIV
jgi:hypothetical protein